VCSDLLALVDSDDPCFIEYLDICEDIRVNAEKRTTTELFNWGFWQRPPYQFYSCTNDDFVYVTPGWDKILCQPGKICYGNDLLAKDAMPTTSCIDGEIVRALGWVQMPTLKYMYGDQVWKQIGHKLSCLLYFPNVIIEHRHWSALKAELDETYKRTNASAVYQHDNEAFHKWMKENMADDLAKIKCRLNGEPHAASLGVF
jgi:hypothetical protein